MNSSTHQSSQRTDWHRPAPHESGFGAVARALVLSGLLIVPVTVFGTWKGLSSYREIQQTKLAAREALLAHERLLESAPLAVVATEAAISGRELFITVCAACHGPEGKGMEGLGRDLTVSDFVARQTDAELTQFIVVGRPDAKPVAMPPKAGRDDLTEEQIGMVVAYLRGLQDPRRMPDLPEYVASTAPSEAQMQAALAQAGGDEELAAYIASGNALFHSSCVACHGKGGVGMPGNGKALVGNAFVQSLDDEQLLAFLQRGRTPSDPMSTTGIQMPPKGGNPALSEDDLLDIISYLRTLQPAKAVDR